MNYYVLSAYFIVIAYLIFQWLKPYLAWRRYLSTERLKKHQR